MHGQLLYLSWATRTTCFVSMPHAYSRGLFCIYSLTLYGSSKHVKKRLVNCFFYFLLYGKDESGNCKVCEIVCCAKLLQGERFLSGPPPMWFGFCIFQSYSHSRSCARIGVALSICWCVLDNSPRTCHISIHNINTLPFFFGDRCTKVRRAHEISICRSKSP